jgi:hypothetical protein
MIGPSNGMLKKIFDPAIMKKKSKTAMGQSKAGGPGIAKTDMKHSGKQNGSVGGGKMKLMNLKED